MFRLRWNHPAVATAPQLLTPKVFYDLAGQCQAFAEDLARRDLTLNAMAEDESGRLVDPYGGRRDLDRAVRDHLFPLGRAGRRVPGR